jgi:hypothetical protein
VFRDVDTSLEAWLSDFMPPGTDVVFDISAGRSDGRAALGLYLHDVREEGELTPGDWSGVRNDEGRLVGRWPPQRRYRLTYLVTAWAEHVLDEHELLGTVLAGCAAQHTLPTGALRGSLVDAGQPIMIRCAPANRLCDPRELWAAWRMPPRTALELSVLAALPVSLLTNLSKPPRKIDLSSAQPPDGERRFGGQPQPVAGGPRPRAGITE